MNIELIILILLCIFSLIGAGSILHQLVKGFRKTNLNDNYVWGIYVQGCFFFSSIAQGILIIIASMTLLNVKGMSLIMEAGSSIAFSLLLVSQILLGVDLGKPSRAILMLGCKNFHSPLTWDFYTLGISTVLSFVYLLGILPSNGVVLGIWALLLLISGYLCLAAHTMFFLSGAKGGYQTNVFMGLETLLYSLLGGSSALILTMMAFGTDINQLAGLQLIIAVLLLTTSAAHKIALLNKEKHAGDYIMRLLNIAIILLLAINHAVTGNKAAVLAAATIAVVLVFVEKYYMVIESQKANIIPEPYSKFQEKSIYRPSFKEWNILFGCIAISALVGYGIIYLKIML